MKTNLVDLVKVTPVSKNLERQQFAPTRGVNSTESSDHQQHSSQTFNQALENHQNNHKETAFQAPSDTVKKPDVTNEKSDFSSAKEDKSHQSTNIQEKVEELAVEVSEEENVELDTITLSTAVQAMQQEINNDSTIASNNGGGESESESKIDTLLSLLSKQTDLKIPKLEQYVSTMRDAGKSVQEILATLKNVLEKAGEDEVDLKDFMLKIVYPKENTAVSQQNNSMKQKIPEGDQTTDNVKEPKKVINENSEISVEKQETVEGQKTVPNNVVKELTSEKTSPGDHQQTTPASESNTKKNTNQAENVQQLVQNENTRSDMSNINDTHSFESETLQLLRDKVNTLLDQFNEGQFKNVTQEINVKDFTHNTANQSNLKMDLPEKLIEVLSEKLNVTKEDIIDFLNSNLIPKDKLQPFIQSFDTVDTQTLIQNNEALMSQMKTFIKLHHHLDSGSKITLQTQSITVETTVMKQLILNRFNANGFNSDFLNRKEPLLFKSSQSVFTVEKLSVRFVNKTINTETSEKGFFKNTDGDFLEKAVQTSKRVFQQTFKNGYETTSQRMSDLERFHAKANTNENQAEHLSSKTEKVFSVNERTPVGENTTETKYQTVSMNDEKDVKGTKSSFEQEANNHNTELKSGRSFVDTVVKNETTTQVRNLEQVYQKIKDMTQLMARQQTRTELATIKLNPPELGRVSLEVIKEGNKISILMQVETKEAQEILNKNSNLLAARLVNNGFELQKVTVQMEKYEEQGNNHSNQDNENNSQDQQNENQDSNNENEYAFEEEYTFADLLKGGIEENAS